MTVIDSPAEKDNCIHETSVGMYLTYAYVV